MDNMIRSVLLLSLLGITALSVASVGLSGSKSSFTSQANNQTNTFSAASVFPTPLSSPTPLPTSTPSPTPIAGLANHIVISEVQVNGNSTSEDFIELYNPTPNDIDISNLRLVKRTSTGSTDVDIKVFGNGDKILAHHFYLWCNTVLNVSLSCDANSSDTLSADNSIVLREDPVDTGVVIDALTIGSPVHPILEGISFSPTPNASQSAERKAYGTSDAVSMSGADSTKGNGYDTDDNATDFVLRTTSQPQNSGSAIEVP
jgi:hypothetical protein